MPSNHNVDDPVDALSEVYLTTRQLASLLHVKERKIYEMAAAGDIPGTRALGKWLFERDAIDTWLEHHSNKTDIAEPESPPNVILGSHDPLLEWAIRESGSGLATFLDGSRDGLQRIAVGEGVAAGLHLFDGDSKDWNVPSVRDAFDGTRFVLVEWAWRQRGLVVAEGNPLGIGSIGDLAGRRLAARQAGAGAQVLVEELLGGAGLGSGDLTVLPPARSEQDAATTVLEGQADAAFGLECLARLYRLDFVPVVRERFDLVIHRWDWFEPPMQRLIAFTRTEAFKAKAEALAGYDVSGLWTVRWTGGD